MMGRAVLRKISSSDVSDEDLGIDLANIFSQVVSEKEVGCDSGCDSGCGCGCDN